VGGFAVKILMVHNYYQQRGGEDVSADSEAALLKSAGHEVQTYTLHNRVVDAMPKWRAACRSIWSIRTYRDVASLLNEGAFDVMHVQNAFPLISPSVFYAARRCGVPVVHSIRNYRNFCLNGCFYVNGAVCERCFGRVFAWPGIRRRCYRGSLAGSVAVAVMQWVHGRLLKTWKNRIDGYIALSGFVRDKLIEAGFNKSRISVKPNVVYPEPVPIDEAPDDCFVFVGRLSYEKGIQTLLEAWKLAAIPGHVLKIIGDGPLRGKLESLAGENVEFCGQRTSQEVLEAVGRAKALVFPSEWYETFGRVAIEAYAVGTPVVASRIGAVQELVCDGRTGLLFDPGDRRQLSEQLKTMAVSAFTMRAACRSFFKERFSCEVNLERMENIYCSVIERGKA
jgi:glycosyltransferase involved in cell wall biosynthesis